MIGREWEYLIEDIRADLRVTAQRLEEIADAALYPETTYITSRNRLRAKRQAVNSLSRIELNLSRLELSLQAARAAKSEGTASANGHAGRRTSL